MHAVSAAVMVSVAHAGQTENRVIDDPAGDSFSFAGRADGEPMMLRGALATWCSEGSAADMQDALREALDTAFHEAVHVVTCPVLTLAASRPEARIADELIATLVGQEVVGGSFRLPFAAETMSVTDGCDLPITWSSVFETTGDTIRSLPGDGASSKSLTEGFAKATLRAALSLGLIEQGGRGKVTDEAASAFLNE